MQVPSIPLSVTEAGQPTWSYSCGGTVVADTASVYTGVGVTTESYPNVDYTLQCSASGLAPGNLLSFAAHGRPTWPF